VDDIIRLELEIWKAGMGIDCAAELLPSSESAHRCKGNAEMKQKSPSADRYPADSRCQCDPPGDGSAPLLLV